MRMRAIHWMGSCQMISSGGDGSEEIISCTISAYSWPGERLEYDPLWLEAVLAWLLHNCPHVGPFVFFFIFLFFCVIDSPPSQWRKMQKQSFVASFITLVKLDKGRARQPLYTNLPSCSRERKKCANWRNSSKINSKDARYWIWYGKQLIQLLCCCLDQFIAMLSHLIPQVWVTAHCG